MITLEPIWQSSTQQALFRQLLLATSYPGRVVDLSTPLAGAPATLGVLAALVDQAVTCADPDELLTERERNMLAARFVPVAEAAFVLTDARRPVAETFQPCLGDIYRPERGATLVLRGRAIGQGGTWLRLSGPGVNGEQALRVDGFDPSWWIRRAAWVSDYPMGVDCFLCAADTVAALPRTTHVTVEH
jgi:alpha-D-ribose 1-methylphosphonate 5-triphosphate synthase subunit PhnH